MIVYAESSAVLSWLLGESAGADVADALHSAEAVVASDITRVECERVLIRAWSTGLLSEADAADQAATLATAAHHWALLRMDDAVVERCARPFPIEPVRTLDAIHLATALAARAVFPGLAVLTLDQRIRENASRLGFETLPGP